MVPKGISFHAVVRLVLFFSVLFTQSLANSAISHFYFLFLLTFKFFFIQQMIELAVNVLNDCIFLIIIEIFDNICFFWCNRLIFKLILLVIKNLIDQVLFELTKYILLRKQAIQEEMLSVSMLICKYLRVKNVQFSNIFS